VVRAGGQELSRRRGGIDLAGEGRRHHRHLRTPATERPGRRGQSVARRADLRHHQRHWPSKDDCQPRTADGLPPTGLESRSGARLAQKGLKRSAHTRGRTIRTAVLRAEEHVRVHNRLPRKLGHLRRVGGYPRTRRTGRSRARCRSGLLVEACGYRLEDLGRKRLIVPSWGTRVKSLKTTETAVWLRLDTILVRAPWRAP
jgi:hypothetical protein